MKNYGFICDVGGKGKGNQDSAFYHEFDSIIAPGSPDSKEFSHHGILALICDGVSASSHGEKGSSFVIRELGSKIIDSLIMEPFDPSLMMDKLGKFILETNSKLLEKYKDFINAGKVPKTTLVGLLIIGQYLWVFNLGDSRAFLIKDDLIGMISVDHIGTGAAHEITQALGQNTIKPALNFYNWAYENDHAANNLAYKNDYYALICSDGLTDVVSPDEIKKILLDKDIKTIQNKVQKLYNLSMERNIEDNISIIAINLAQYFSNISKVDIIKLSYPEE